MTTCHDCQHWVNWIFDGHWHGLGLFKFNGVNHEKGRCRVRPEHYPLDCSKPCQVFTQRDFPGQQTTLP